MTAGSPLPCGFFLFPLVRSDLVCSDLIPRTLALSTFLVITVILSYASFDLL